MATLRPSPDLPEGIFSEISHRNGCITLRLRGAYANDEEHRQRCHDELDYAFDMVRGERKIGEIHYEGMIVPCAAPQEK